MTAYKAGVATYPGNTEHIVGEIKGPTTYGRFAVAVNATYDAVAHSTRVSFNFIDTNGLTLTRDSFGIVRVKP